LEILLIVIFSIIGLLLGFSISKLLERQNYSSGNIVVIKNDEKTLYSLELDEDPEIIGSKKRVVFKVVVPDDESDRR